MPTKLLQLRRWLLDSPEQHQWMADHLDEWSARVESLRLGDASPEGELASVARLSRQVAQAERNACQANSADLTTRQPQQARGAAEQEAILHKMRSIAAECKFPVSVNISGEQAWEALTDQSGAICWCINAGARGASGRVDALVSFDLQGKVVDARPWNDDASDLEASYYKVVLVAAASGAWHWDKLHDESTRRCILESLREISFPPQRSGFSVLYSIAIGQPTRTSSKGASAGHLPMRLCR